MSMCLTPSSPIGSHTGAAKSPSIVSWFGVPDGLVATGVAAPSGAAITCGTADPRDTAIAATHAIAPRTNRVLKVDMSLLIELAAGSGRHAEHASGDQENLQPVASLRSGTDPVNVVDSGEHRRQRSGPHTV